MEYLGRVFCRARGWDTKTIAVQDLHDFVDARVGVAAAVVQLLEVDAGVGLYPLHRQCKGLLEIEFQEVGFPVSQDVGPGFERCSAEQRVLLGRFGVSPAEVVVPAPHSDVPKRRAATSEPNCAGAVHVAEDFVIVEGEERRHVAMPGAQGCAPFQEKLVILPDADDGGCEVNEPGRGSDADLLQPAAQRKLPHLLINPVAVLNREVNLVADLAQHRRKRRQGEVGSLVVAAGEFEAEVE
jgi:hypothetical protein